MVMDDGGNGDDNDHGCIHIKKYTIAFLHPCHSPRYYNGGQNRDDKDVYGDNYNES